MIALHITTGIVRQQQCTGPIGALLPIAVMTVIGQTAQEMLKTPMSGVLIALHIMLDNHDGCDTQNR